MAGKQRHLKEVVVVDCVRSAIGKSGWKGMEKKGLLHKASGQDLMMTILRGLVDRVQAKYSKFDPAVIEDIILGVLSQIGEQGGNMARVCGLLADIPVTAAGATVNRYCNAGLQSIAWGANSIMTGAGDCIICGGVEMMSHYRMGSDIQVAINANYPVFMSKDLEKTRMFVAQGFSAELVAEKYNVNREDMDKFGLWSQQKAVKAQRDGVFAKYIIPFKFETDEGEVNAVEDETLRPVCVDDPEKAYAGIAKLEARFKKDGNVTAGNSSQIVDGAAACMIMSEELAEKLNIEPLARFVSWGVAGDDPYIMLDAPIPAMEKSLKRAGLTIDDMDCIEPNEAFASPPLAFARHFGYAFDDPRQNPTGGAIALGHPIGASGCLYFNEMVHWLHSNKKKYGLQGLCGGGGNGIAAVVEAL